MLVTPGSERVKSFNQYVNLCKVLLETSYMYQYVLYSIFFFSLVLVTIFVLVKDKQNLLLCRIQRYCLCSDSQHIAVICFFATIYCLSKFKQQLRTMHSLKFFISIVSIEIYIYLVVSESLSKLEKKHYQDVTTVIVVTS